MLIGACQSNQLFKNDFLVHLNLVIAAITGALANKPQKKKRSKFLFPSPFGSSGGIFQHNTQIQ